MRTTILGLCLIACTGPAGAGEPATTITYKYTCCGLSMNPTIYSVTVASDGTGVFRGQHGTAIIGQRRFAVRPGDFDAFASLIARYGPDAGPADAALHKCSETASEGPWVEIDRSDARGTSHFQVDFGDCARLNQAAFETLKQAPLRFGIDRFIQRR